LSELNILSAWRIAYSSNTYTRFADELLTDSFRIGDDIFPNTPVKLATSDDGGIGMDFFYRFRVTFDFPNNLLLLEPRNGNLTGVQGAEDLKIKRKGQISVIQSVRQGSASTRLGVEPGDQVVRVDGVDLVGIDEQLSQDMVDGYAGQTAWLLLIKKDGTQARINYVREQKSQLPGASVGLVLELQNDALFVSHVVPDSAAHRPG
jgi:hypothetical protein